MPEGPRRDWQRVNWPRRNGVGRGAHTRLEGLLDMLDISIPS